MYRNKDGLRLALLGLCDVHKTKGNSPNYFDGENWLCLACWVQLGRPKADKYIKLEPDDAPQS